jgi:filamentous hemagglutinin
MSKADADGHCDFSCAWNVVTVLGQATNAFIEALADEGRALVTDPRAPALLTSQMAMGAMTPSVGEGGSAVESTGEEAETTVPLVRQNAAIGKAWQDAVATDTGQSESNVQQNVMLRTQSGVKTQMDVVSTETSGKIALREAKSSATARLTKNQTLAHPEIEKRGAVVIGAGKPGYPGGSVIPPTKVQVVRPPDPKKPGT